MAKAEGGHPTGCKRALQTGSLFPISSPWAAIILRPDEPQRNLLMNAHGWGCAPSKLSEGFSGKFMLKNSHQIHWTQSLLLAALVASGATLACSGNASQNAHANGPAGMPVKVEEAKATPVNDATEYVATLKSRDSAVIMPQVEGQVLSLIHI